MRILTNKQIACFAIICGLTLISAGSVIAGPKGAVGDLYVVDSWTDTVVQVDSATGNIVGDFVTTGLSNPIEARFDPDGNLFVVNYDSNSVTEYDGQSGDFIRTFADEGITGPSGLRFTPNGNLLVYNDDFDAGYITEYNTNGSLVGVFASNLGGGAGALDFGKNGNLFVSNVYTDSVEQFAVDGTDLGLFASGGGLDGPHGHAFGPDGNLFVCSFHTNSVIEYDGTSGLPIGTFISTNLDLPIGIAFAPDGNVWVSNLVSGDVNEFDGNTGKWIRQVSGFTCPQLITIKPAAGPDDCLNLKVSTLIAGQNAIWDIKGATAGTTVAVVYGLQAGSTVVSGQLGFCATFGIQDINPNHLVGIALADNFGNASISKTIPRGVAGLTVFTQAAERGTCPDECVSNVNTQVVQ